MDKYLPKYIVMDLTNGGIKGLLREGGAEPLPYRKISGSSRRGGALPRPLSADLPDVAHILGDGAVAGKPAGLGDVHERLALEGEIAALSGEGVPRREIRRKIAQDEELVVIFEQRVLKIPEFAAERAVREVGEHAREL